MYKISIFLLLTLVFGQSFFSIQQWRTQQKLIKDIEGLTTILAPPKSNKDRMKPGNDSVDKMGLDDKLLISLDNTIDQHSEEQRNINHIILQELSTLSRLIDDSMPNEIKKDAKYGAPTQPHYQPANYYDEQEIDAAEKDSYLLIQERIEAAEWTEEDNIRLLTLTPFLDQTKRDDIREQLMQAINDQRLALDTPLILPF